MSLKLLEIGPRRGTPFDKESQLTPDLIPYLYSEHYEKAAERFLQDIYPEALKTPIRIDPQVAIKKLGLSSIECSLSPDGSVLARTHFKKGLARVYDKVYQSYRYNTVEEGTVLYDNSKLIYRNQNLTLIHEVYHQYTIKPHLVLKAYLQEKGNFQKFEKMFNDSRFWIEQQAKVIPPRILMPEKMFRQVVLRLMEATIAEHPSYGFLQIIAKVIDDTANFFGVSKKAAKRRMIEIGIPEARGVWEFVDGRYINNFAFDTDKIGLSETLTISEDQFYDLYLNDEEFQEVIDTGKYCYADGHVVLNRSDIVFKGLGMRFLTDKALSHLERYALVFSLETKKSTIDEVDDFVFNRLYDSVYETKLTYKNGIQYANDDRQNEKLNEQLEREEQLLMELPNDFEACMLKVKEWQECTFDELVDEIGCAKKTLERLFHDNGGNLQLFVLVMVYLQLPSEIISHIFKLSRFRLSKDNEGRTYRFIMRTFQGSTVQQVKTFLEKRGIKVAY